ncbi:hypothetical protein JQC67_16810 [Aurantibacter crassamenti]|uniref:hypothetical protein n=1 Tax=Aurantibacter crassamenti TaxID=1837375 RepID=UPI00193A146A|nr:hypothetical protein [Aurantibacter crassamenti]MBM1107818.1 hypothetical protein [Aurantibacter crassamenti]
MIKLISNIKLLFSFTSCLLVLTLPFKSNGQVQYGAKIESYNGIKLFQDSTDSNAYYYLPEQPRVVFKDDVYKLHLWKYLSVNDQISGGVFSALVEFSISQNEKNEIEKVLKKKNHNAFLKAQIPLLTFKEDHNYGNASFTLLTSVFDKQNKTTTDRIITSGNAPIQDGSKASLMLNLTREEASLLEQSLKMGTSDLSIVIRAYYPAKYPAFSARISIPSKKVIDMVKKKYGNVPISKSELENTARELRLNSALKIELYEGEESDEIGASIVKMVSDKIASEMFLPNLNCNGMLRSDPYCLKQINRQYRPTDSLYIAVQKSAFKQVPVISVGNLNVFKDSIAQLNDYVSTVPLNDRSGSQRRIDFKINEDYLGAFKHYINGVSVQVRNDSTSKIHEFSFSWSDILAGHYQKQINLKGQEQLDSLIQYKVLWSIAKADTLLSSSWRSTSKPFISLTPPLEKRTISLGFDGASMADTTSILIDFAAKLGGKKRAMVLENLKIENKQEYFLTTLTLFTDFESDIVYRTSRVRKSKGVISDKPRFLNQNDFISIK